MKERSIKDNVVCVVGLGYVGLPLAEAFSKHLKVIGYDINARRIDELNNNKNDSIEFTNNASKIKWADFILNT